jgi:nucleoid-associated protein YgaU
VTASRYAGQATITVPQDDGTTRPLGVPRVALALTAAITYQAREGDRLDLLAAAALNDSTGWWRIADANPSADAAADTQPGTVLGIPGG